MDVAEQWGLPPGFRPVRYVISDAAKAALRGVLGPNEPVIISISNEGDSVAIVGTPFRVFTVKTSELGGSGVSGANVKEFPWEGIQDIVLGPLSLNVKISLVYRSSDGRIVATGRKAALAKEHTDHLMAFEKVGGTEIFRALLQVKNYKKMVAESAG